MKRGETPTSADVYQSTTDQIIAEFKEKIEEIDRELGCASENVVALMREEGRISDQQAEEAISRIVALKSKKAAYMGFIKNAEENTGNHNIAFGQAESTSCGLPSNGRVVQDAEQIINQQPHVSDKGIQWKWDTADSLISGGGALCILQLVSLINNIVGDTPLWEILDFSSSHSARISFSYLLGFLLLGVIGSVCLFFGIKKRRKSE